MTNSTEMPQSVMDDLQRLEAMTKAKASQQSAPAQSPSNNVMGSLIESFTSSANAIIDYINHSCKSRPAFQELVTRHNELTAIVRIEYDKTM